MKDKEKHGSTPVQSGSKGEPWPIERPDLKGMAELSIRARAEKAENRAGGVSPAAGGASAERAAAEIRMIESHEPPAAMIRESVPAKAEAGKELAPRRGPGRPPGSTNKRDTEIAEELIAEFGDPLEAHVRIGSMDPAALITELRCLASDRGLKLGMTVGEILKFQRECRNDAMPYLHSKRAPVDPNTGETVLPVIGFGTIPASYGQPGDDAKSIEEMVENQKLIDVTPEKSDEEKSDDDASD